ncbi:MAG TPA: hypothetical protein VNS32_11450 [Flavisolibacter sp.]|nr:hypothetical protein [Flavisolibacter sp.]
MRKFVVTILAFVYLSSTSGAIVHLHYCMDKFVGWGLWHNDNQTCSKCGMDKRQTKDNGCCKDEHKQLKVEGDHNATGGYQLTEFVGAAVPATQFELPGITLPTVTEQNPLSHAPPRSGSIPVYIRNCIFRI